MTIDQTVKRYHDLARTDPVVAALATLQAEALRASADSAWAAAVPVLDAARLAEGRPLLHGQTLTVDVEALRELLQRLAGEAGRRGAEGAEAVARAARGSTLDVGALAEASITQSERLSALAEDASVDVGLLATLGQLMVWPLLQAVGRQAAPLLQDAGWDEGFCPTCAAWPTLAESRGLERERWLRCGRCGSGWKIGHQRCAYCQNQDHHTLGYLAPEAERESRQAATCDECSGYLKTLTTVTPFAPAAIAMQDLTTLELDMAALERGYGRPERPGVDIEVQIVPAARRSRLPWRR